MTEQPGYDLVAERYARAFPSAYQFPVERHAAAAFSEQAIQRSGITLDVGCGLGHVTADLAARGLEMVGVDPSPAMLAYARSHHPDLCFELGDATLSTQLTRPIGAVIARFSLIHSSPVELEAILSLWSQRLGSSTPILVAMQGRETAGGPVTFDHAVAPAWRWHPDSFSALLDRHEFSEDWRLVYRDPSYQFPMFHLCAHRR